MKRILLAISLILFAWASSAAVPASPQGASTAPAPSLPTETPSPTPLPTITLTLFRDADSLTLLVPASNLPVSLVGLEYRVTMLDGQTIIRRLDRDFASFFGLPFGQINMLGAVCFRLVKSGANIPVPIECTNGPMLLTQQLAAADGFWHDPGIGVGRVVMLMQDGAFVGLCPAEQSACTMAFTLRPVTPTPTPSVRPMMAGVTVVSTITPVSPPIQPTVPPTPGYPCEGQITSDTLSSTLRILHETPNSSSNLKSTLLQPGQKIIINRDVRELGRTKWYSIVDTENRHLGWVAADYVVLAESCPL